MSYLSPQAGEIVADNHRQPTDMTGNDWFSTRSAVALQTAAQAEQAGGWLHRRPPGLRNERNA